MGFFGGGAGGGAAAGWSQSLTSQGPMFRRGFDSWTEDDLGKLYDHAVVMRLGRFVKPYKWRMILSFIGVFGYALTAYIQPLLIGLAIDAVRGGHLRRLDIIGAVSLGACLAS